MNPMMSVDSKITNFVPFILEYFTLHKVFSGMNYLVGMNGGLKGCHQISSTAMMK